MRSRFDLIVVGGGPAGAATAIRARTEGLDVLVLEGARFPPAARRGVARLPLVVLRTLPRVRSP